MDEWRAYKEAMREMLQNAQESIVGDGLKLIYRFSSILEFYRMAMVVTPTGNERKHADSITGRDNGWKWYGVKDQEELMKKKFSWKEKVQEI